MSGKKADQQQQPPQQQHHQPQQDQQQQPQQHPHAHDPQLQGWHSQGQPQQHMYPYGERMTPQNVPHDPGAYSGGPMMPAGQHHHMMSGVGPPGGGSSGAPMYHYPNHGMPPHASYHYPPQHQPGFYGQHHPHHPHGGPPQPPPHYYHQYPQHGHHHPSQYAPRNSPHPMEHGDDPTHHGYYGYGGYMGSHHPGVESHHPHHTASAAGDHYGMMPHAPPHHPGSAGLGEPPQHHVTHAPHHEPSGEIAKTPQHHGTRGGSAPYDQHHHHHSSHPGAPEVPQHQHPRPPSETDDSLAGAKMIPTSASMERRLSFQSADVKPAASTDDATLTSTEGVPSPPGIPPTSASRSGTLSSVSDEKTRTPESHDVDVPLREASNVLGNNHDSNKASSQDSVDPTLTGSSEKKQTLDTASVLLAFSSTKKPRPASETSMMDDNDSKCSFPTLPTEPSFSSMISEPPTTVVDHHFIVPPEYPNRLRTTDDEEKLNSLHCYMRSDLLEIVVIESADEKERHHREAKNIPTSSDPQMIGRVGLRCVFCGMSPDGGRAGPSMSIFYPRTVSEIYRLVTSWKRCHLSKCRNLPPAVRQTLNGYKDCRARGKTAYWIDSAHMIGLVDIPTKIGGIRFQTDATGKILSAARPASQVMSLQSLQSSDSKLAADDKTETTAA